MAGNIGVLAGSFLNAFTQAQDNKRKRDSDEKYKKALTMLLESQLEAANTKAQAQSQVQAMMSPQAVEARPAPQFDLSPSDTLSPLQQTGLTPGPSFQKPGMSLLDMLSDPEGQMALTQSNLMDSAQKNSQLIARSELSKQMESFKGSPEQFFSTAKGLSLATQAGLNPAQFMESNRAAPPVIRSLRAVGIDPAGPEGREIVLNSLKANGVTDEALKAIQLQLNSVALDETRRKREQEDQDRNKQRQHLEVDIRNTISKGRELAQLNDSLEATVLATGQPLGKVYRSILAGGSPALEALGFDTQQARKAVEQFDRFNKLATDFGLDLIDRLQGTGAITNTKFQALQTVMAGIGTSPGANRLIIADVLQQALDGASIEDVKIPNREEIENLIGVLKSSEALQGETQFNVPEAAQEGVSAVKGIAQMSLEQLQRLDIATLSEEALREASKRWKELNAR